jgi:hypothetical protein
MRAKLRLTVSAGRATPVRCASTISAMVLLKECSARPERLRPRQKQAAAN